MLGPWGVHKPIWSREAHFPAYPVLKRKLESDVAVIGGGITGLTTALLLQEAGLSVVVLTEGGLGHGMSGASTAHISSIPDLNIESAKSKHGIDKLQKILASTSRAIAEIESRVKRHKIRCHFKKTSAFRFSETSAEAEQIARDLDTLHDLGVKADYRRLIDLPFPVRGAIEIHDQAEFDPLLYLHGLAKAFLSAGGLLFEHSKVDVVEEGRVTTSHGEVKAENIVLATHTPVGVHLALHTRLVPYFTYVMAVRLSESAPEGLYWDMKEPYHFIRGLNEEDRKLLIVGGCDQRLADGDHPWDHYKEVSNFINERFDIADTHFYWGGEILESTDQVPFIGKIPLKKSIYTACGFAGCGMSFGTLAALINTDLILGRENQWASVYDPSRIGSLSAVARMAKENLRVMKQMADDWISREELGGVEKIPPGEGKIIEGPYEKIAVYKDTNFQVHALSPVCGHMGGIVHWNPVEKSWDCPCHGSRYSPKGEVICGPSLNNLEPVLLEDAPMNSAVADFKPVPAPAPNPDLNPEV